MKTGYGLNWLLVCGIVMGACGTLQAEDSEEIKGIISEMREIEEKLKPDSQAVDFETKYAPRRALRIVLTRMEAAQDLAKTWEDLTAFYQDYPDGPEAMYEVLAPVLLRTKYRMLAEQQDGPISTIEKINIRGYRIPDSLKNIPKELRESWQLARAIYAEKPSFIDSGRTPFLDYHSTRGKYYTLMAESLATSTWDNAASISSCSWGNGCGTGSGRFYTERDEYGVIAMLGMAKSKPASLQTGLIHAAYMMHSENTEWRSMVREQFEANEPRWEAALAGLVIFDGYLDQKEPMWNQKSLDWREEWERNFENASAGTSQLLCQAVTSRERFPFALNLERIGRILMMSGPVTDKGLLAQAYGVLAAEIEDLYFLKSLRAAAVKQGVSHAIPDQEFQVGIQKEYKVRLIVNGEPFSNRLIAINQSFAAKKGGSSRTHKSDSKLTDADGVLVINRQDFTLFDNDRAFLSLFPDYGIKQSYGKGWQGAGSDNPIFCVSRSASELAKDSEIHITTHDLDFDLHIEHGRLKDSLSGPVRLNIYHNTPEGRRSLGSPYTQVEIPAGEPIRLRAAASGRYEIYIAIPGCSIVRIHDLKTPDSDFTHGPVIVEKGHRITWDAKDKEDAFLLKQVPVNGWVLFDADELEVEFNDLGGKITIEGPPPVKKKPPPPPEMKWSPVGVTRFVSGLENIPSGKYKIEFREKSPYYRHGKLIREKEIEIKPSDPAVIDLGAAE